MKFLKSGIDFFKEMARFLKDDIEREDYISCGIGFITIFLAICLIPVLLPFMIVVEVLGMIMCGIFGKGKKK